MFPTDSLIMKQAQSRILNYRTRQKLEAEKKAADERVRHNMRQREQDLDKTMTRIDDKWRHHHYLHIPLGDSSPSPSQHLPQIREAENKPSQALPSLSPTSLRNREAEEQPLPPPHPVYLCHPASSSESNLPSLT